MLLYVVILCTIFFRTRSEVSIDFDGGYKNLVIGINPLVRQENLESTILEFENILTNASEGIYTATRKQAFFKEVIFVFPKFFQTLNSSTKWTKWNKRFKNPNVFINTKEIYSNIYTVQHAGCGKPGLRIHVPTEMIHKSNSDKATHFVREWSHYRYGVFAENGFPEDEVYPTCYTIPGSNSVKITDCTDTKAIYEFRKSSSEEIERFPAVCQPIPLIGKNRDVESSLMTKFSFPNVKHFCDGKFFAHNRDAPTKQNALCREKSTWEIISQNSDFKTKKKSPESIIPNFKYVLETDVRVIVTVDSSRNMALNDRMDMVRNAFSYFILNDVPENITVGIINLKDSERSTLISLQTQDDADRIIDAFPEVDEDGTVCVECGILNAVQILKSDPKASVLVITATDLTKDSFASLSNTISSSGVVLHVVFFKKKMTEMPYLHKLAKITKGHFFYIPEDFESGNLISPLTMLYEAFRSIYQSFSWMNNHHVLIDEKTFTSKSIESQSMPFYVDNTAEHLQVLLTGPSFLFGPPVLKDSVILQNEQNSYLPGHSSFAYKMKIPAYIFSFENPEAGQWTLSFRRRNGYDKPVIALVRAKNKKLRDIISLSSWITEENNFKKGIKRPDLTLYAEVKSQHQAVINTSVMAFVHHSVSNTQTIHFLSDAGEGDPDVTKNDGIFSKYLNELNNAGYYLITIVAEAHTLEFRNSKKGSRGTYCCGSEVPTKLAHSDTFKRIFSHESIFITTENLGKVFPPRRIIDLRVERVESKENNIKYYALKWTAPGDNLDSGTAADYQMKVFLSRDDALNDFDTKHVLRITEWNIHGPWLVPQVAGTTQTAIVELKNLTSGIYFVAMRTIGQSNQKGDVSNVVQIQYEEPSLPNVFSTACTMLDNLTFTTLIDENDSSANSASNFKLAIGITCGVLFLCIVIGVILLIYFAGVRKKKLKSGPNQGPHKTESNDTLCHNTKHGNVSVISPVHSWGADSLISHYETHQKRNNFANGTMPIAPQEESDATSVASRKYFYSNKLDQNSTYYDPVYFYSIKDNDQANYPFNPAFSPFSPIYTSSLRRTLNGTNDQYSPDAASIYSSTFERRLTGERLKTDV